MKNKETIKITTDVFKLEVYYNGVFISAQVAIFIGLMALSLFATNDGVTTFCKAVFWIDVIAVLIAFLHGIKIEKGATESTGTPAPNNQVPDVQVDQNSNSNASSVRETSGTINNKVPTPTQQGVQRTATPPPAPAPAPTPTQQVDTAPQRPEPEQVPLTQDISNEDWDDLFSV